VFQQADYLTYAAQPNDVIVNVNEQELARPITERKEAAVIDW